MLSEAILLIYFSLNHDSRIVCKSLGMPVVITILAFERKLSYGTHVLYHLTADGTSLTGRKVAVVTVCKVYSYFACRFHLELIESCLCFRNEILAA